MADRSVCVRRLKHADPSAQSQAWKVKLFVKDAGCIFFPRDLQKAIPARIDPEIDQHLMSKWLYTKLGFKLADLEDTDKQRLDIQGYLGTRLLYFTSDCFPGTTEETRFIIVESLDGDEVIVLCPSKKANNEAPALVNVTEALVFVVEDVERTPGMVARCLCVCPFLTKAMHRRGTSVPR